jgi:RND family efflux transporter MFP subunit
MKKLGKKRIIVIAVACIVVVGAFSVKAVLAGGDSYAEETAKIRTIETDYSYEGNIEAKDAQMIYATGTSTIKKIYVSEGDTVKKGDLLYELEGDNAESKLTQAQASVTSARVSYQDAERNLSHMTELYSAGAVSQSDYEQAKSSSEVASSQLTQAQANYDAAKKDLDDLKCYAEVDGEVSDINAEESDTMLSGTEIMDVINYDHLIVKIKVDEFDLNAVTEGQQAKVSVTALNKEVGGTVTSISKKAEVVNGVSYFTAEVALQPDTALKVGLSAEVSVTGQKAENAVTISMNALNFNENNAAYVLTKDPDGKAKATQVTVGMNDGSYAEIKDGLKPGDTVLIEKSKAAPGGSAPAPGSGKGIFRAAGKSSN